MSNKISALLSGQETGKENIFPFLWVHGEPEETIREYMEAVHRANIGAVCVESRPHPDFLGPQWWHDMDVILDEARRRGMKVWILDDSHFPTGYANGALEQAGPELCRQSLVRVELGQASPDTPLRVSVEDCAVPPWSPNQMEQYTLPYIRTFDDDRLLGITAVKQGGGRGEILDLTSRLEQGAFPFQPQEGEWTLCALCLTRNRGPHRSYINMMIRESCRVLIDTVYEAHWQHYREDFGKTIAGFFSDEPEIGNGHLYAGGQRVWELEDQAWSPEIEEELRAKWGDGFITKLPLLFQTDFDSEAAALARKDYMEAVTQAVKRDFSLQIGDWCRAHGVEYIGHLIEDNNQHLRTVCSLGHYFRGLYGQDMAGIDDIGGQVLPQGEWNGESNSLAGNRNGLFFHYVLGKLGASLAALDPKKQGRCMCELFGAYGWEEGVRLEKYICDHFLVRGINRFVPHAFSLKDFPDPDCPPHFYAHGHNPQYRHFGALMGYLGRMSALFSGGRHEAAVAVLYNAEADWMGECMSLEAIAQPLAEAQIDYDFVPIDVFTDREAWKTSIDGGLTVNRQKYKALLIPGCDWLPESAAKVLPELEAGGCPVMLVDRRPRVPGGDGSPLQSLPLCQPKDLPAALDALGLRSVRLTPENTYIRCMQYIDGSDTVYMVVNEAAEPYTGKLRLPSAGPCYAYNAWLNRAESLPHTPDGGGALLEVTLLPRHSLVVVFGDVPALAEAFPLRGGPEPLNEGWIRSTCKSIDYPAFGEGKAVTLPDRLAEEDPLFSGLVRYERSYAHSGGEKLLELTDAYEGAELFVNGESLGIQIVPPFRWELGDALGLGENQLRLEIATTLERETSALPNPMAAFLGKSPEPPSCPSGINGEVRIWSKE